jgi:hypothetical protein
MRIRPAQWTVLCYASGNQAGPGSFEAQLERVSRAADGRVGFAVQHGDGVDGVARRLVVPPSGGRPQVVETLGRRGVADRRTLRDALVWAMRAYPARHFAVLLSGHGLGFQGVLPDEARGGWLTPADLEWAFRAATRETGQKVDIVDFDACLMGCAEGVDAVARSARYVHASEEVALGNATPSAQDFGRIARSLGRVEGRITSARMLEALGRAWTMPTLVTTVRCDRMVGFERRVRTFARLLLETATPPGMIRKAFRDARAMDNLFPTDDQREMRDVVCLAEQVAASPAIDDARLKRAAKRLAAFVRDDLVVGVRVGRSELRGLHGLSIYAPVRGASANLDAYRKSGFAQRTRWDRVVRRFGTRSRHERSPRC